MPGRGRRRVIRASFHKRWTPRLIKSFIRSYLGATLSNTPRTSPALSAAATRWNPKWVSVEFLSSAIAGP